MDLIVVFCILFVFMLVLYCFCVATEFSVNKDLYKISRKWYAEDAGALNSTVHKGSADQNTISTASGGRAVEYTCRWRAMTVKRVTGHLPPMTPAP